MSEKRFLQFFIPNTRTDEDPLHRTRHRIVEVSGEPEAIAWLTSALEIRESTFQGVPPRGQTMPERVYNRWRLAHPDLLAIILPWDQLSEESQVPFVNMVRLSLDEAASDLGMRGCECECCEEFVKLIPEG